MTESKLESQLPPFAMVPRWIIQHKGLTSGAVRVYACLADMANRDKHSAWPSHRTLAIKCNMSVSSVRRHLKELVYVGALVVKPRFKEDGISQTSNIYTVIYTPVEDKPKGATKNKGVSTSEQGAYSPEDNKQEPIEQEPIDIKKRLKEARQVLAK
jgi:DNA-binding transcriptional MocR family regulator